MNEDDKDTNQEEIELSDTKIDPIWEHVASQAVICFDYGQIIEKEWLIEMFEIRPVKECSNLEETVKDVDRFNFEYLQMVDRFKKIMLERYKRALKTCRGVGYMVVDSNQQTQFAEDEFKSDLRKAIQKASSRAIHIDEKKITQESAQKNAEFRAKLAFLIRSNSQMERTSFSALEKGEED